MSSPGLETLQPSPQYESRPFHLEVTRIYEYLKGSHLWGDSALNWVNLHAFIQLVIQSKNIYQMPSARLLLVTEDSVVDKIAKISALNRT